MTVQDCTHEVGPDGPHQIKGLPRHNDKCRNAVDCPTQKALYAELQACAPDADLTTQYRVMIENSQRGREPRLLGSIEYFGGFHEAMDALRKAVEEGIVTRISRVFGPGAEVRK